MSTALQTTTALKEWDAVVAALEQGSQALLIRKGGLDDPGGRLPVPDGWFWLCLLYTSPSPRDLST